MIEKRSITFMANHRGYFRYAAESETASKAESQQGAWVTVTDVAEKIRFHMSLREELLLAGLTFASCKELLISSFPTQLNCLEFRFHETLQIRLSILAPSLGAPV